MPGVLRYRRVRRVDRDAVNLVARQRVVRVFLAVEIDNVYFVRAFADLNAVGSQKKQQFIILHAVFVGCDISSF